jgi:Tfp pilus assembly protein PilX
MTSSGRTSQSGSALILVIMGAMILSLIGIVSLSHTSTELSISRNFLADKSAFFLANSGINFGVNELRDSIDPGSVSFEFIEGNSSYKTGSMTDVSAQFLTGFKGFAAPPPVGVSIEMGGDAGVQLTAWNLLVSSKQSLTNKNTARKEILAVVAVLSANY